MASHKNLHKLSTAGLLISLGIIYGDIGTSPLYVFKAIIDHRTISKDLIFGGISLIFWTLTLQTTIKYVLITLQADNKGEGGIFSLFSLVRRKAKWLVIPALIGGSALLADGIITPSLTVSSAIEGLNLRFPGLPTIPIVLAILTALFIIQRFGTSIVGRAFGPVMFIWFGMLAVLGIMHIQDFPNIVFSINPYYAYHLLSISPDAFLILGGVFLCTTGAEALYSDLGHAGRSNIRVSWIFVKISLILNYMGQGAALLHLEGSTLGNHDPFFNLMPEWFLLTGIGIATLAAIIASQALISGSFTLISEAVRLNLWPKVKIKYPSLEKGQLYVPSANLILWIGCMVVVLLFRESKHMEEAYGLSITVTMLMTTVLVAAYLLRRKFPLYLVVLFVAVYGLIEGTFLWGNVAKILHGGWFTLLLGSLLFSIMWVWFKARRIKNKYVKFVEIEDYYPVLKAVSEDASIPKYASNLVYLTSANFKTEIESKIMYSLLQKQPKRADIYWLVHIDVMDEPFTKEYKVEFLIPGKLIRIDLKLGFKVGQLVSVLFREVVDELVKNGEVDITSKYPSLHQYQITGDFRFVILEKIMANTEQLGVIDRILVEGHSFLKRIGLSEERGFGLDPSFVTLERVPLVVDSFKQIGLKRINNTDQPA
jgi:KUP system potassium uptake protein